MTAKRPKDMTDAEREALPKGPIRRDAKGRMTIETGMISRMERDDIVFWRDSEGSVWSFGQWSDGAWYKRAAPA